MDNKDSFIAAKILVDFIRDYTSLAERQLLAIRNMMEATVRDIMDTILSMSSASDEKIGKASEVLVKNKEGSDFEQSKTLIKEESDALKRTSGENARREFLENQLRRAGGVFSKHMEALTELDDELQDLLMRVAGSVSMDDVMGQRLNHVISSIALLHEGIAELLSDVDGHRTPQKVKDFRNKILTQVYVSYTSEDEKNVFHEIFGQPKEAQKAS